jgi:hypothetical protein
VKLFNAGNTGLTGTSVLQAPPPSGCLPETLEPGVYSGSCNITVVSSPNDFEQGSLVLNVTAQATDRATAAAVTAGAEHRETLVQSRRLSITASAEPNIIVATGEGGVGGCASNSSCTAQQNRLCTGVCGRACCDVL